MKDKKTFFISTSIPYVNAAPHTGHALEFVQADIIARYQSLAGSDVFFLSGTDDNALKNVKAAEAANASVGDYILKNTENFKTLLKKLDIKTNDFIQTSTDKRHKAGAQKLWSDCKREDIYKKKYKGFYCLGCEEYKTEKNLTNGECIEHPGVKLEIIEEENYFFKLSNYQEKIFTLIEKGTIKIVPETRKNETLAFIKGGLEDFSISRSYERAHGWGIPVPNDPSQIMYVWFDALSNYINALGYGEGSPKFKKYWENGDERLHAIGKGINRFHTIYWPAMLLSAGVALPTTIFIHGYITIDGQKMSKSVGNVIDPNDLIKEYGTNAVREILARHIPTFEDGDFTKEKMKEAYNADLANGLGNLTSRILKMSETHLDKAVEVVEKELPEEFCNYLNNFEIQKAADFIWQEISDTDLLIQQEQPFKVIKEHKETGQMMIRNLVRKLYGIAVMLQVLLPQTAKTIISAIKENKMPETPLFPRKD